MSFPHQKLKSRDSCIEITHILFSFIHYNVIKRQKKIAQDAAVAFVETFPNEKRKN